MGVATRRRTGRHREVEAVTRRRDDRGPGIRGAASSLRARLELRRACPRVGVAAGRPASAQRVRWPAAQPPHLAGCDQRVFDLFRDAAARDGRAA
jgi:hypothetical protein